MKASCRDARLQSIGGGATEVIREETTISMQRFLNSGKYYE